jgi:ankyrin repeat protein
MTAAVVSSSSSSLGSSSRSCSHHSNVFDDYLEHCHRACSKFHDWDRLLFACQQNKLPQIKELVLEQGVDPFYSNPMKQSALHIAARNGHVECLDFLLNECHHNIHDTSDKKKAAVNAKNLLSGATPLHCCFHTAKPISKGHDDDQYQMERRIACAHLLIRAGAQINVLDAAGKTPLQYWRGGSILRS